MSKVKVIYTGSSGKSYDLKVKGRLRIRTANFHNYEWAMDTTKQQYGVTVDRFRREAITYSATLLFEGSYEETKELLESLHADFERDIINGTPGTLTWGDYSIRTFVYSSSTAPDSVWTKNDVKFYCPYPFWTKEMTINIFPFTPTIRETDKKFPYQYPYSYAGMQERRVFLETNHYAESDFKIVAYGPFSALNVNINGDIKHVDYEASAGEYMVIDSRQKGRLKGEAYLVQGDGTRVNVFDYRAPECQLFKKVPPGRLTIDYSRQHGIDLTVFLERSEPIWTSSS